MDPLQIVLIVLAVAGIWAIVEVALSVRRVRTTLDGVDKAVTEANEAMREAKDTLSEARPVIAKLDATVDDLQPALERMEPLLESAHIATNALSADLVEVEAVIRDVSSFTGAAANAGNVFTTAADTASAAVQRLIGKVKGEAPEQERKLEAAGDAAADALGAEAAPADTAEAPSKYFTYDAARDASAEAGEENHD